MTIGIVLAGLSGLAHAATCEVAAEGPAVVAEPASGSRVVAVALRLDPACPGPRDVALSLTSADAVVGASACGGVDASLPEARVTLSPGEVSSVELAVRADDEVEGPETVRLLAEGQAVAALRIDDPDCDPRVVDVSDGLAAGLRAATASGARCVVVPPGRYVVDETLDARAFAPGVTYVGDRVVVAHRAIDRAPSPPWTSVPPGPRLVSVTAPAADSPLVLRGFTFIGTNPLAADPFNGRANADNLFFSSGSPDEASPRLRVVLDRVSSRAARQDALHLRANVEAAVCGFDASDVGRNGISVTGNDTVLAVEGAHVHGHVFWAAIDLEIDEVRFVGPRPPCVSAPGEGGACVTVRDSRFESGVVDLAATRGSVVDVEGLVALSPGYALGTRDGGSLRFARSTLTTGPPSGSFNRLIARGAVLFDDVTFRVSDACPPPLRQGTRVCVVDCLADPDSELCLDPASPTSCRGVVDRCEERPDVLEGVRVLADAGATVWFTGCRFQSAVREPPKAFVPVGTAGDSSGIVVSPDTSVDPELAARVAPAR